MTKSIMIVGVGGQGTLLASRILGSVLLGQGYDVKVSEVHGMSQRGGSVVTYVRFGDKVASPVIEKGQADLIIAFEALEAARWVSFLKKGGRIVMNTQEIEPMPVITGAAQYPEGIVEHIRGLGIDVVAIDALDLAVKAGTARAVNVVLMGVISHSLDFGEDVWMKALEDCVPKKVIDVNKKAFALGRAVNE
ncbi:MAG: indolepyruvate oxidoreductase subunit beta [Oscillospiraceae bacterium]|nr:indolepyruvate oxidoreductase subunit beta [Oscillospiraceae bacterium]MBQ8979021.1 indolepyruvate oxidoreductase subunit beta [Oscillospiraceae bacterium]